MQQRWCALLLAVALLGVAAAGVAMAQDYADPDPIYRQTFEKKNPKGWSIEWNNNTVPATASLNSGQAAHKSEKGLRVTLLQPANSTSSVRVTSPEVDLEADNFYTYKFYASSKPKAPLRVVLYNANETGVSYVTREVRLSPVWSAVQLTFRAQYTAAYRLLLSYGTNITTPGSATLAIDTFEVYDGLFSESGNLMTNEMIRDAIERAQTEKDQREMLKKGGTQLVIGEGGQLVLKPKGEVKEKKVIDQPAVAGIVQADNTRKAAAEKLALDVSGTEEAVAWEASGEDEEGSSGAVGIAVGGGDKEEKEEKRSSTKKRDKDDKEDGRSSKKKSSGGGSKKKESDNKEEEEEETISVDLGSDGDADAGSGNFASLSDSLLTTESEGLARGNAGAELFSG